jgi:cellulose synthase/poly-beta-1,6-N-acetylglucosamine synthase-like glycosyltransferase
MVTAAVYIIILVWVATVALPVAIFLLESVAAIALPKRTFPPPSRNTRDRIGILIPAHDEEQMLPETIAKIQPQLRCGDRLLVVADNCSDRTAAVAKDLGADVVERTNAINKGKGFALDWGIRQFANDPPKIVVVVDADCKLGDFAIDHLAALCSATNRPAQACYSMVAPPDSGPGTRIREFAWRVKNWIRPLGLSSAGLPCQLMGTGMAFPWEIIASAKLATGALVEDLELGLELAADGHPPIFCPAATVTSEFPATREGSRSQQLRWEQGHLGVIAAQIPWFFADSVRRGDKSLLVLALDAAVPPLSLLWMAVLLCLGVGVGSWRMGMGSTALLISVGNLVGFTCAATASWIMAGRDLLRFETVLMLGVSALRKLPLYYRILIKRASYTWIRTDRRKL